MPQPDLMPRPPEPADPDKTYEIRVRIPGWLKNDIAALAEAERVSMGEFCEIALWVMVREKRRLPVGLVGRELPSVTDELRLYLAGERVLMPCGLTECQFRSERLGGFEFCGSCGIRVG